MLSYLIRRILLMIPTLLGVSIVTFAIVALSPGGLGGSLLGPNSQLRPEERKAIMAYYTARYGIGQPVYVQYLRWLGRVSPLGPKAAGEGWPGSWKIGFKIPDLGESWQVHRPISDLLSESLPITLLLEFTSLPVIYLISIVTGIQAARSRGKVVDVGLGTFLIGLYSMPEIWIGVLMIGFLTNKEYLHWFPSNGLHDITSDAMPFMPSFGPHGFERGWLLDTAWHLVLPLICLSYGSFAYLSRLTRGSLLETLGLDFVRTARAKGLMEKTVIYAHAFRNSLLPLITVTASFLPGILAGAVIIETIFGLPGMGQLFASAAINTDRELLLALTLIFAVLLMISFLLADIAYAIADPRVSYVD
ncbi:MAG TPA: ABC transporter permease [Tepidisphaeraceae bacterium]|jgi:microcin C transport system permease protein|nr:ABC transporter permease [Tepidisphaeraceae bacterium]